MSKWKIISIGIIIFICGYLIGNYQNIIRVFAGTSITQIITSPTSTITPGVFVNSAPAVLPTAGNGPKNDIIEITHLSVSKPIAQVGDDINFSVTIQNQAPYAKLIKKICFNSTDGNFGCTQEFNFASMQIQNFNNSTRFTTGGVKTIWITWSQDGINFYRPVNSGTTSVTIQD